MIARIREYHAITIIAILQTFLIVVGWLVTCIHLKFRGYPDFADFDPLVRWSSLSLFVRNWVLVFFVVPGLWVFHALWLEERSEVSDPKAVNFASGLLVISILFWILWIAATDVSYRTFFIRTS